MGKGLVWLRPGDSPGRTGSELPGCRFRGSRRVLGFIWNFQVVSRAPRILAGACLIRIDAVLDPELRVRQSCGWSGWRPGPGGRGTPVRGASSASGKAVVDCPQHYGRILRSLPGCFAALVLCSLDRGCTALWPLCRARQLHVLRSGLSAPRGAMGDESPCHPGPAALDVLCFRAEPALQLDVFLG